MKNMSTTNPTNFTLDDIQALAMDLAPGTCLRVNFTLGSRRGWHREVYPGGDVSDVRVMVGAGFSIRSVEELTI